MSVEAWTTLWIGLLWLSASAFGLVTLYIAAGYVLHGFVHGLRSRN